jgi:lysozyme family protein
MQPEPKQWRNLTERQRYNLIEAILIKHRGFTTLIDEIDYCARFTNEIEAVSPPCLAILGETGAGKTRLIEAWLKQSGLRRSETPQGSVIPYLYVSVPTKASIKGTASAFLHTLGDPNPGRGTQWNMVTRLHNFIKECRVQMIFVDEFQHIVDKETKRVLHAVADFLKDIINQTRVPMILIGRAGEAEPVLNVNPQLDRRIGSPLYLRPFVWDRETPETTILEFRGVMEMIDQLLPFDYSGLSEESMAYRFYYATNGYIGWIIHIIRYAAHKAIKMNSPILTLEMLASAYNARIAMTAMGTIGSDGRRKENPFLLSFVTTYIEHATEQKSPPPSSTPKPRGRPRRSDPSSTSQKDTTSSEENETTG